MWSKAFWLDVLERAVKTAGQAVILFWGADVVTDLFALDLVGAVGVALGGAVLSILTSIVSAPISSRGTASVLPDVEYT